ncbi:MAG: CAAX prenyl protease-related protein [Capsulimonas sp.]|jgi:CAAX prenyl protease-like protein|uniref:CAAX prenyl protease-related protein n=1 Tax=Capsulimonas sp. TaxID=2494211 RepID=UPI003264959C
MSRPSNQSWLHYVVPFALFILLTSLESFFSAHYPAFYAFKIAVVAATLLIFRPADPPTDKLSVKNALLAIVVGAVMTGVWVTVDPLTHHFDFLGKREEYNPFTKIGDVNGRSAFLAIRFLGLVAVVPLIEELFYRGFLLRFVTDMDNFRRVPPGVFNATALAVNILLFAFSHPEWLVAAIFSAAMCGLMWKTKDLRACVLAHAVCNLLLGIYVVHFNAWKYW